MRLLVLMASVIVLTLTPGCGGEDDEPSLFSKGDAERHLKQWLAAVYAQDVDKIMGCSGTPFRFRSRTWSSVKEARANLALQMVGLKAQLQKAVLDGGEFRCFSYGDLKGGQFPERARVEEDRREIAISRLGVRRSGFVAWLHVGRRSILKMVLNTTPSRDRLVVEGIDPR